MTSNNEERDCEVECPKPVQALFNAVSSSKLRLVRLLIEGGIHVDTKNNQSQTPLLATCSSLEKSHFRGETRERVVKYLIAAGANVNAQDNTGRTPLIYAIITQAHASVIFDLIEAGAELWLDDNNHNCAFDYAVQRSDVTQVGVIVEAYKRHMSRLNTGSPSKRSSQESMRRLHIPTYPKQPVIAPDIHRYPKQPVISPDIPTYPKPVISPDIATYPKRPISPDIPTYPKQPISPDIPTQPEQPMISPQVSTELQVCSLCKNIFQPDAIENAVKDSETAKKCWKSTELLDLNISTFDLSGFLYRRRSTGSVFAGLTEQRCESIRRKQNLGITLEDLFSSTEINQPIYEGQPLFVKSPRMNTMVDISSQGLGLPVLDMNRTRSVSVSLPPLESTSQRLRFLGEQAFSFSSSSEEPWLLGHELLPKPSKVTTTSLCHIPSTLCLKQKGNLTYASDSQGHLGNNDSDDDYDDILLIPSSQVDMMSAKNDVMSSQQDISQDESATERAQACNSPIPKIVLTDVVKSSEESEKKKD